MAHYSYFLCILAAAFLSGDGLLRAQLERPASSGVEATWEGDYARLLKTYVKGRNVDYAAWKANKADRAALVRIASQVGLNGPEQVYRGDTPEARSWEAIEADRDRRQAKLDLAYYINAYNVWTLKKVLDHYPFESVSSVLPDFKFFQVKDIVVNGITTSLDHLEKKIILPKYNDPRAHFAVNCASIGCPRLRPEPFRANMLEQQLDEEAKIFANNTQLGVKVSDHNVRLSQLFKWYAEDFKEQGGVIPYLNKLIEGKNIPPDAKIEYIEYDWGLNDVAAPPTES